MSMTPIVDNGQTYLIASLATLATVLTPAVLAADFSSLDRGISEMRAAGRYTGGGGIFNGHTAGQWAAVLASTASSIDPVTVRAVIALALQGGGMTAAAATDTAERLCRSQLNRHMDLLAATIVQAVVAAGV
jgi:hypothetical protein